MLGDGQQASVYKFENTEPGTRGATRGVLKCNHYTQKAATNSSVLEASYEAAGIWDYRAWKFSISGRMGTESMGLKLRSESEARIFVFSVSSWESELRK